MPWPCLSIQLNIINTLAFSGVAAFPARESRPPRFCVSVCLPFLHSRAVPIRSKSWELCKDAAVSERSKLHALYHMQSLVWNAYVNDCTCGYSITWGRQNMREDGKQVMTWDMKEETKIIVFLVLTLSGVRVWWWRSTWNTFATERVKFNALFHSFHSERLF